MNKYGVSEEKVLEGLSISEEIWKGICKGKFEPTKNLIFSLAFVEQFSYDDTAYLMGLCGYEFNDANVKDIVVSYLLRQKVYNLGMINAALAEYKVTNLFLK